MTDATLNKSQPPPSQANQGHPTPIPDNTLSIPDHYFLIHPENEAIIRGDAQALPPIGARSVFLGGIPFLIIGIGLGVYAYLRWQAIIPAVQAGTAAPPNTIANGLLWIGVATVFNLFVFGLYLSGVSIIRKRTALQKRGVILWGIVTGASGRIDRFDDLRVTVEYRFDIPKRWRWSRQQRIEAKATEDRNDLRERALPSPGAPVAVLYLNKNNYELL